MQQTPRGLFKIGRPDPDVIVRVVCEAPAAYHRRPRKGREVLRDFKREDRWDGSGGTYWVHMARMTEREREIWDQGALLGSPGVFPRDFREDARDQWRGKVSGFRYMRDDRLVTDPDEGKLIGNAMHHDAGWLRRGTPAPGTLDGVRRVFGLECPCGQWIGERGEPVEAALDELAAEGVDLVGLRDFRARIARHAGQTDRHNR